MKNWERWRRNLIVAEPHAPVQVEKGNDMVMEGLGSTMTGGNTKGLYEHFLHHLQLVLLGIRNTSEVMNQQFDKIVKILSRPGLLLK